MTSTPKRDIAVVTSSQGWEQTSSTLVLRTGTLFPAGLHPCPACRTQRTFDPPSPSLSHVGGISRAPALATSLLGAFSAAAHSRTGHGVGGGQRGRGCCCEEVRKFMDGSCSGGGEKGRRGRGRGRGRGGGRGGGGGWGGSGGRGRRGGGGGGKRGEENTGRGALRDGRHLADRCAQAQHRGSGEGCGQGLGRVFWSCRGSLGLRGGGDALQTEVGDPRRCRSHCSFAGCL